MKSLAETTGQETWVVDASPLIVLARVAKLDWLECLHARCCIPQRVIAEVDVGRSFDPAAADAVQWATPRRLPDIAIPPPILAWGIDPGESQVIAHALRLKGRAVLDDAAGRRCAQALGLPVLGSLGVVLHAKAAGLIPNAAFWLNRLREARLYMDEAIMEAALAAVDEPTFPT